MFFRLVEDIAHQLLGVPLVISTDDFPSISKRILVDSALVAFSAFCCLLGIKLKGAKSEDGPDITLLGLRAPCPYRSNRFELSARLGETERTAWMALVGRFPKTESISQQEIGQLFG